MCFTIHILIVDDREEYIEQIKKEISPLSTHFGSPIVIDSATNFFDALQIIKSYSIEWDVLITNVALGDPSVKSLRKLGVNLAEVACEIGLTTVVISAGPSDSVIRKLYREFGVYDLIFKVSYFNKEQPFEERLGSCISDILAEKLTQRQYQNYQMINDRYQSVDAQAHVADIISWLAGLYNINDCQRIIDMVGLDIRRINLINQTPLNAWQSIIDEAKKNAFIPTLERLINTAGREFPRNDQLSDIKQKLIAIKIKASESSRFSK